MSCKASACRTSGPHRTAYFVSSTSCELSKLLHLGLVADLTYSFDSFVAVGNYVHHLVGMSDDGVCDVLVTELRHTRKPFASSGLA